MTLRHFITTLDYSKEELLDLLELIRILKVAGESGYTPKLLPGASLAMIFEEPFADSHIDIVARFSDESTILYNWTDDTSDPRFSMLATSYAELRNSTTESGKSLTLVPLPMPEVQQTTKMTGWRKNTLTDAAYSNYLVANNVVLVPVYGHTHDERALKIIAEHFPDREVIGIEVVALIEHGGAIGCVTQPQPAAVKPE